MGEAERQEHADVMEYLHRLANQHGDLSREMAAHQSLIEHEIADLKREVESFCTWRQDHVERASWFYEAEPDIRQIVESTRWLKTSRKILAWILCSFLGAVMAYSTIEIFIRDHMPK